MFKYILKTFIGILIVFLFAGNIYAANNLSIRIEQPKTPTNQNEFDLVFVTLDIKGRDITVKCFEKGPNDGSFRQFGENITIPSGGDTKSCHVDSSIVNTNGTYQFYATATADSETVTSQTDTIDFNNSNGPGAPTEFNKTKINSCEYKITYKTADDIGKTVKVELYRSDNQQFSADSSTRVGSHDIGSNIADSFTDSGPDCTNKTYYHVLRAFDAFGNGSGLVGDASVTITTETTNTTTTTGAQNTTGAIPVSNANANVLGGNAAGQENAGEEGKSESEQVLAGEASESSKIKEVKGAEQMAVIERVKGLFTLKNGLIAIAIAILTGGGYWWYNKVRKVN